MNHRLWIMGSATTLAVLILLVTLLAGHSTRPVNESQIIPIDGLAPALTEPTNLRGDVRLERAQKVYVEGRTRKHQLVKFVADLAEPQSDDVVLVTRPRALIHKRGGQVIEIVAETGRVVAPDDQLRYGHLFGQVLVTFFDVLEDKTRRVRARIRLQDARFDVALGELTSEHDVVVEGGRFLFEGRGLLLTYNELQSRIDRLVINEGKRLTFRRGITRSRPSRDQDGSPEVETPPPSRDERQVEWYEARFEENVHIKSGQIEDGRADRLTLTFQLGSMFGGQDGSVGSEHRTDEDGPELFMQPGATESARSDINNDMVIKWSGQLVIAPHDNRSPPMTNADDMLFRLEGTPLHVRTTSGERVEAVQLAYQTHSKKTTIRGSTVNPLHVISPNLGKLTVPLLEIDQQYGIGRFSGPGQLHTLSDWPTTDRSELGGPPDMPSPIIENMIVSWKQGVDLTFYHEDPLAASNAMGLVKLPPLRSASFQGQVHVQHDSMNIAADRIGIGLAKSAAGKPQVQTMTAQGHVMVDTAGDNKQMPLSVQADEVTVSLERADNGDFRPNRMHAQGHVKLDQQDKTMQTEWLDVELSQVGDGRLEATNIEAKSGVRMEIQTADAPLVVHAHRLVFDNQADEAELFGREDQTVRFEHGQVTLSGLNIKLIEDSETMKVVGPGRATFRPRATLGDLDKDDRPLTVTWSDSMTYRHAIRQADFKGDVRAHARSGKDTTELTSQTLHLVLADRSRPRTIERDLTGDVVVQRIVATENVEFLAVQWQDEIDGEHVVTRLRIAGPKMEFNNTDRDGDTVQQIRFVGAGEMGFEDYRPQTKRKQTNPRRVQFSGRGITAFTWTGQMVLDAWTNDMSIYEDVWMVHRWSKGKSDSIQMSCDQFVADLFATGGLATWTSGRAPQPSIKSVTAERVHAIWEENEIRTHTLEYSDTDQFIVLTPAKGAATTIDGKYPITTYEPLYWNAQTGRMHGSRIGATRVQIR